MNDFHGLSSHDVQIRQQSGLINNVHLRTSRSLREIFIANVFTRFNLILGLLLVVVLVAGSPADGLFGIVLIANSTIGVLQEWLAKRKLDALTIIHAPHTTVLRNGVEENIPTSEIVLDDYVLLRAGDEVPVDGVVLRSNELEINEANLTGEIDSVHKSTDDTVLSGTIATAGHGLIQATSIGPNAYAHRLATEARVFSRAPSEVQESINTLLKWVTWVLVGAIPLQIWSYLRRDVTDTWQDHAIRSVSGLVGLVPEGLVLLATLAFLSAAVSVARHNVLVQELPSVEILARVNVVCLDKTGTLTSGEIVLERYEILQPDLHVTAPIALSELVNDSASNNTQLAIAREFKKRSDWKHEEHIPFDSSRKWKAVRFTNNGSWYLGAPEVLLPDSHSLRATVNELAQTGRRVMLLSTSATDNLGSTLPNDLTPAMLLVLKEEVRGDAAETLEYFAQQGVRIMVLSGDNPHTVAAIAHSLGLEVGTPVDARTIGESVEELRDIAAHATVLGRVSPQQKRNLVHALQDSGDVVAMTGDGVNDALALKRADIGIAMSNAAPATKAVAQLILLDGKFSHLPHVLLEGRRVIANIERVSHLFVAKNAMSAMAIVLAAVFGTSFPILPRQMTLLSSVTIGIPAFFLALGPNARLYTPGFLRRIVRFAVPMGLATGVSVIAAEAFSNDSSGTAATLTGLVCFFGLLTYLSRPLTINKSAVIVVMMFVAALAMTFRNLQDFFGFTMSAHAITVAVIATAPLMFLMALRAFKNSQEIP